LSSGSAKRRNTVRLVLLLEPSDVAARVRAALAYANIDVKSSDDEIGISRATMARIVSPSKPRGASVDELWLIADKTGVPRWFLEGGFDAFPDQSGVAEIVNQLRRQMQRSVMQAELIEQLRTDLEELREGQRALVAAALQSRRELQEADDRDRSSLPDQDDRR